MDDMRQRLTGMYTTTYVDQTKQNAKQGSEYSSGSNGSRSIALQEPFFYLFTFLLFYFFTFSCHARGNAECSGNRRQNTNCCLNHELPNFLFLFHNF